MTTSGGTHSFSATISSTNGATDQNNANNNSTVNFSITKHYSATVVNLALQTDHFGTETTWKLTNSAGTELYHGGPYTDTDEALPLPAPETETFNLANNDCYTFTIYDSVDDGMCCDYGNGSYTLTTAANEIIATGGAFEASESKSFRIGTLSTTDVNGLSAVYIYPNPTSTVLNVVVENKSNTPESYTILNTSGQILQSKKIKTKEDLQINVSNISQGIYFLKLSKNQSETNTIRFIKK